MKTGIVEIDMIMAFAEILVEENVSEKIKAMRLSALNSLHSYLIKYKEMGYCEKIISGIAEKKIEMIKSANTKTEINKIITPSYPHYDYGRFIPNQYNVPEEELIGWSQASLIAPLNSIGTERYMEVFRTVFPEMKI